VIFNEDMLMPDSIDLIDDNVMKVSLIKSEEDSSVNLTNWKITQYKGNTMII
jgi:hypothetical protein